METWLEEHARDLHRRLLADDPVAPADFAEAALEPLIAYLIKRNPGLDPHLRQTAAEDAILALIRRPESYDPRRGAFIGYLYRSAQGDLQNGLARERRHAERRADLEAVELSPMLRKYVQDTGADPARIVQAREELGEMIAEARAQVPDVVRAGLSDGEARALALLRQGERKTEVFAAALGIAHLAVAEQRREVKRVKDRVQKRIERSGGGDGQPPR